MLFNSHTFCFVFLPIVLGLFHAIARRDRDAAATWFLTLASAVFYGFWSLPHLALIIAVMFINYGLGKLQARQWRRHGRGSRALAGLAVGLNVVHLGFFKYTRFLLASANELFGSHWPLPTIALPLAISFYTFQKIAYQVDAYRGENRDINVREFSFFVLFFPQLIAGPIALMRDMLPQIRAPRRGLDGARLARGLSLFVIGLTKKVLIADTIAMFSSPIFERLAAGGKPDLIAAWGAALGYSAQLYFDFSGYSDMAIGLAWFFGLRLPLNFDSPYKATSIIDFWRRWHMSLSRFLRDYVYIPLGGNRRGAWRRYFNLLLTMVIGGIWHGAGWGFAVWGAYHGGLLIINHGWQALKRRGGGFALGAASRVPTFLAVVVGWVFFRCDTLAHAGVMLASMAGRNGCTLPAAISPLGSIWNAAPETVPLVGLALIALGLGVAMTARNSQTIVALSDGDGDGAGELGTFPLRLALSMGALLGLCVLRLNQISEFLYFQF